MNRGDLKKYAYAFFITTLIFATAIGVSNYITGVKVKDLKDSENQISVDILSSETQFTLLGETLCTLNTDLTLSDELNTLGERLSASEPKSGGSEEFKTLKEYYSILEIKDFLLMKKIAAECRKEKDKSPIPILYFYANDCGKCAEQGYVLTYLRDLYPRLRVYSFDYNLGVSAVKTLISLYKVPPAMPALVIKEKTYGDYKNVDAILSILPELKTASSTATTTKPKR